MLAKYAIDDPGLIAQAQAFASPAGFNFLQPRRSTRSETGAGGASGSGGAGGAGVGGWVHLSDARNPPDFGRIAWYVDLYRHDIVWGGVANKLVYRPEDILGSVEVDGQGGIIGNFQPSGTYRIVTNQGMWVSPLTPHSESPLTMM